MGVQLAGKTKGMSHRNGVVMYARAEISNLISSSLIYHNFISYMCSVAWNYYFKEINEKNVKRDAGGTDEDYDRPLA